MSNLSKKPLDPLELDKLVVLQNKVTYPDAFSLFGETEVYLPDFYEEHLATIDSIDVRDDDVWLCTFIKAGTNWMKELIWLLVHDCDFEGAMVNSYARVPFLEFDAINNVKAIRERMKANNQPTTMDSVKALSSPRVISTHLPIPLLPKAFREKLSSPTKIVYVARNPRDVAVSHYHHRVLIEGYLGSLDDHVREFVNDTVMFSPYWKHIEDFWTLRDQPNVFFVTFEEMKKDLGSVIDRMADFLGKSINGTQKEKLLEHLSFESMKKNPHLNLDENTEILTKAHGIPRKTHFMRKGTVGSWKDETMSQETIQLLDNWISKNRIHGLWDELV